MYQKTIIVGNLGRDPEMRYTPSGTAVTNFSVAVSRRWTGRDGTQQEKTTWFRVAAWEKLAELSNQYLSKGRRVLVEGEVDASAWQGQDGQPRASLELTARNIQFLGGPNQDSDFEGSSLAEGEGSATSEEEIPF